MKALTIFFIGVCVAVAAAAQDGGQLDYFVTANGNLFLPGESAKGIYPILGYDKETDPKLMVGGFGLGVSAFRKMKEGRSLKFAASISKNTYWDEPIELRGYSNEPLGVFQYASSDLSLALNGTFHFFCAPEDVARRRSRRAALYFDIIPYLWFYSTGGCMPLL